MKEFHQADQVASQVGERRNSCPVVCVALGAILLLCTAISGTSAASRCAPDKIAEYQSTLAGVVAVAVKEVTKDLPPKALAIFRNAKDRTTLRQLINTHNPELFDKLKKKLAANPKWTESWKRLIGCTILKSWRRSGEK